MRKVFGGSVVGILALGGLALASADEVPGAREAVIGANDGLTGREIYQRVLDNKLDSAYQEQRILSTDPGAAVQELSFWSRWKDYRHGGEVEPGTVISKTMIKFTAPFDKRETGYLFIEKHHTENEGFHYSRFREKVMRISTSRESIFGSDFTLEDVTALRHIDDATYKRHHDEEVQGIPVFVVEVFHKPESNPQYSRSLLYIHKETNVPLRTRHWNHAGFEEKELTVPPDKLKNVAGVWIPMEATMRDLAEETHSTLFIDRIEPNVELPSRLFTPQRLAVMR